LPDVPALVEALAVKAAETTPVEAPKQEVKELIATQESAATKPKAKRKRPAKKKPAQN
jgi:hypothetical protein